MRSAGVAVGLCAAVLSGGCGGTVYAPRMVARGELVLRYDNGFELWGGGQRVAAGLRYRGLPEYVQCVPEAHRHAQEARRSGTMAVTLSALGATFGVLALGGLSGLLYLDRDTTVAGALLGSGVGVAAIGTFFAGFGRMNRNAANGHAVDAMNYYNDAVGSLGATCADLRYPPPTGPAPPEQTPPPELPAPPALGQ